MHKLSGSRLRAVIRTFLAWAAPEEKKPSRNPEAQEERESLQALQRSGDIKLGTGKLPEGFWNLPRPKDPAGSVREALIRERKESA